MIAAHAGISVDDFEAQAHSFLHTGRHPTLDRAYLECAYAPMVELLQYLEANGFANYIASGGGRDFMRPISDEMYGIPRDRVIGSSTALDYMSDDRGGTIMRKPEADVLDDGPQKPIRIWSRVGRRPLLAAGNSNGDIPMLDFAHHADKPFLRLLVLHDDADREFDYTTGAEASLERARGRAGRWSASRTTGRGCSSPDGWGGPCGSERPVSAPRGAGPEPSSRAGHLQLGREGCEGGRPSPSTSPAPECRGKRPLLMAQMGQSLSLRRVRAHTP